MRYMTRMTILVCLILGLILPATAEVPHSVNMQGQLTDAEGNPVAPGVRTFTFAIFNAQTGGVQMWPPGPPETTLVTIEENGLWNTAVGAIVPLVRGAFGDTARWLEITVDDGVNPPETLDRVEFTTSPYAFHAALAEQADSLGDGAVDHLADRFVDAAGDSMWGPLVVAPTTPGDASVRLPDDAINPSEILAEPGIAGGYSSFSLVQYRDTSVCCVARDLISIDIDIPTSGYILVQGLVFVMIDGVENDVCNGFVQIDEEEGGSRDIVHYTWVGTNGKASNREEYQQVALDRVYMKPAGSYTFRLEVGKNQIDAGAILSLNHERLTAMFFPTSYGPVMTTVTAEEAAQFERGTPVAVPTGDPRLTNRAIDRQTMYQVDLRELELKAAREQAEAEKAQRELLEAKLRLSEQE